MAKMKDVAKHANVGVATVSRVINNSAFVSESTRKIVENSIKELGYVPNELARNFQKNKTNIIGVVVPSIEHAFTNNLLKMIELELQSNGYLMMVAVSKHNPGIEEECIQKLISQQVGGLIITAPLKKEYDSKFPLVSFDRKISDTIPFVYTDNYGGSKHLTTLLLNHNCKKILYVDFNVDENSLSNSRKQAFKDMLEESNTYYEIIGHQDKKLLTDFIYEIIDKVCKEKFDGIFFGCDYYARIFYSLYFKINQQMPENLKVVSFDALSTNNEFHPLLTSAGHDYEKIAKRLTSLIFSQMNNHEFEIENKLEYVIQAGETA